MFEFEGENEFQGEFQGEDRGCGMEDGRAFGDERAIGEGLTVKQRLFVEAFVGEADGNATRAARIAGYANADKRACRLRWHPKLKPVIEERLRRRTLSANQVLERLTAIATASITDFIRIDTGSDDREAAVAEAVRILDEVREAYGVPATITEKLERLLKQIAESAGEHDGGVWRLDLAGAKTAGVLGTVQEITMTRYGPRVKLFDQVRALELLGRRHRLFSHAVERAEPGECPGEAGRSGGISYEDALKYLREEDGAKPDADERGGGEGVPAVP